MTLWLGKLLIIEHLLLLSFFPSEALRWSLVQNIIYTSFFLSAFEPLMYVGSQVYVYIKLGYFWLICIM